MFRGGLGSNFASMIPFSDMFAGGGEGGDGLSQRRRYAGA